jgi:hypothetical protein
MDTPLPAPVPALIAAYMRVSGTKIWASIR